MAPLNFHFVTCSQHTWLKQLKLLETKRNVCTCACAPLCKRNGRSFIFGFKSCVFILSWCSLISASFRAGLLIPDYTYPLGCTREKFCEYMIKPREFPTFRSLFWLEVGEPFDPFSRYKEIIWFLHSTYQHIPNPLCFVPSLALVLQTPNLTP